MYFLIHVCAGVNSEKIAYGYSGGRKLKNKFAAIRLSGDELRIAMAFVMLVISREMRSRCSFGGELFRGSD